MLVSALAIFLSSPTTVFQSGEGGFHTYRIPSLYHTTKGTTLAFVEGRASQADAANNSLVLRTSTDEGKTWGAQSVIAKPEGGSFNNPCIVETSKGELILHYQHYPAGTHEFDVPPGWTGERAVQACKSRAATRAKRGRLQSA
ncbi:MAG: sialidase family protein [Fimbriimonadaceae bacterium]